MTLLHAPLTVLGSTDTDDDPRGFDGVVAPTHRDEHAG
jgi:hypothetical protein